jgi:hypothetical protein
MNQNQSEGSAAKATVETRRSSPPTPSQNHLMQMQCLGTQQPAARFTRTGSKHLDGYPQLNITWRLSGRTAQTVRVRINGLGTVSIQQSTLHSRINPQLCNIHYNWNQIWQYVPDLEPEMLATVSCIFSKYGNYI